MALYNTVPLVVVLNPSERSQPALPVLITLSHSLKPGSFEIKSQEQEPGHTCSKSCPPHQIDHPHAPNDVHRSKRLRDWRYLSRRFGEVDTGQENGPVEFR